ncbi:SDR family oxidoreductase [Cohnella thailandensis]|uniref:SDR family oxidoreductase n=1 Tax=Cohnella thailandensis TaxID=557557 RepID=A0A841SSM5_9BACL|nr:SDR family oxidoreductase [Cohnella thailandensis]MBB6632920.1 SDR family oxidoreductase [Cohnella thailandensis]MBP1975387.1 NAD(P)-dependent dehydrogenase (short-subunit alcohol dehydrogenase family) [Cohnella thailandensis]
MHHAKNVLITGANKGIGYETARQLGAMGFMILLGTRNEEKGKEAVAALVNEGVNARFILLDVTNQDTIEAATRQIEQEFGSLDVLINNAGVSLERGASPSQLELAVLKETFETNFFGMFAVTKAMLSLLTKSPSGRIVNLSSGLGSLAINSDPKSEFARFNLLAYNSSKTAVNALTVMFAKEFKNSPLKINAADPGYTATDLNRQTGYRSVEQAAGIVVRLATLPEEGPTGGFFDENGEVPW